LNQNISIVFVTAYNEYAVEAFELNVLDYVLKPISKDRMEKTIARVIAVHSKNNVTERYLMEKINEIEKYIRKDTDKLVAWDGEEANFLKPDSVIYLSAGTGTVSIVTRHDNFISKESLESWESRLKDWNFFRCHRSYLINLNLISKIIPWIGSGYIIKLDGTEHEIPVSRNRVKELKKRFNF
jgi:DNA-binding LytR/AlgR family response regulator